MNSSDVSSGLYVGIPLIGIEPISEYLFCAIFKDLIENSTRGTYPSEHECFVNLNLEWSVFFCIDLPIVCQKMFEPCFGICDNFSTMYRTDNIQVLSERYQKTHFERSMKHSQRIKI